MGGFAAVDGEPSHKLGGEEDALRREVVHSRTQRGRGERERRERSASPVELGWQRRTGSVGGRMGRMTGGSIQTGAH